LTSSNRPIDGLAVRAEDGTIRIVLTNFDQDTSRQPYMTKVDLEIEGVSGEEWKCTRHWTADRKHGNSYQKWVDLRKPPMTDEKAKQKMLEASKFGKLKPLDVKTSDGQLCLRLEIPSPGIRFIELSR
jgi:beta-xylosidase